MSSFSLTVGKLPLADRLRACTNASDRAGTGSRRTHLVDHGHRRVQVHECTRLRQLHHDHLVDLALPCLKYLRVGPPHPAVWCAHPCRSSQHRCRSRGCRRPRRWPARGARRRCRSRSSVRRPEPGWKFQINLECRVSAYGPVWPSGSPTVRRTRTPCCPAGTGGWQRVRMKSVIQVAPQQALRVRQVQVALEHPTDQDLDSSSASCCITRSRAARRAPDRPGWQW